MRLVECELINDCLALKRQGNSAIRKPFRVGQRVIGTVSNIALTPDSQVLALKTKDGYIIPEPFLNIIREVKSKPTKTNKGSNNEYNSYVDEAEVLEENNYDKSISNVYQSLKSSKIISSNSVKSKRIVNFAIGGAAICLIYAMLKGKNKLVLSAIGGVAGGFIGNYVGKKIKENGDE